MLKWVELCLYTLNILFYGHCIFLSRVLKRFLHLTFHSIHRAKINCAQNDYGQNAYFCHGVVQNKTKYARI